MVCGGPLLFYDLLPLDPVVRLSTPTGRCLQGGCQFGSLVKPYVAVSTLSIFMDLRDLSGSSVGGFFFSQNAGEFDHPQKPRAGAGSAVCPVPPPRRLPAWCEMCVYCMVGSVHKAGRDKRRTKSEVRSFVANK